MAPLVPHHSFEELHNWWRYRRTRKRAEKLARRADHAEKERDGRKEELAHGLAELDEEAKELKAAYEVFHALGAQVGAKRPPLWTVWAKATALAIIVFVFAVAIAASQTGSFTPIGFLLSGLGAVGTWVIAAVYFYRHWMHPSAREFRKMARLRFQEDETAKPAIPLISTPVRTLPEESPLAVPASRGDGRAREAS